MGGYGDHVSGAGRKSWTAAWRRPAFWVILAVTWLIAAVCIWAFTTGRPAIGIGVLIAFYMLPTLVLMPVRVRRSQRRAAEARARREQGNHLIR